MLVTLGVGCLAVLVFILSWQLIWAWGFAKQFPPQTKRLYNDEELPRVVVLLPIRGADPSLAGCLRGLLNQDYPHYEIRVIIDSPKDPAWTLVHEILDADCRAHFRSALQSPCVHVSPLQKRRKTCGLKSSALLQAIDTLDESCQVVALIDADVIPYPNWLRDLVQPLADPQVGATTGIRWFMPDAPTWGALVRYLWNAAAVVQMHALHIPWGGSLALRAELLGVGHISNPSRRHSDLVEKWGMSLWEDTGSYRTIRDLGLQLAFVPAATMINRETTDLRGCFGFIRRQMLNVRLYHDGWPAILVHGVASSFALLAAFAVTPFALAAGSPTAAALLLAGPALYALAMGVGLVWIERQIRRLTRERGQAARPCFIKTVLAFPLVHVVYFACLASASMLGKVSWRGITYDVSGPWTVRMRRYRPYRTKETTDQHASVV